FLSLNYVPAPYTMVDGIEKLPPAHVLDWVDGTAEVTSFWSSATVISRKWTLKDAQQELDSLLRQSVREHLIADVPVGIWASGGLYSTTILYYAAKPGARLKTFSISSKGRSFDERKYIRDAAGK